MHLVLGITGCSGVIYGARFLEVCQKLDVQIDLVVSPTAEKIIEFEIEKTIDDLRKMASRSFDYKELEAPISSGSARTDGMVIAPCSMKSLSSLAFGISNNLILRAADVALKEGRKLVIVPRETPLSLIHLESMVKLKRAGADILPAAPGFYHIPNSIEELVDFIVGKILDQFGIEHQLYESWGGLKKK